MLSKDEIEIYCRRLLVEEIGLDGQLKMKNGSVLVIGAGGLGCPVLQYLCAAGVGTIGIADHDTVDVSNLQRQILFGYSSLGKPKALEAMKRLNDLNPFTQINTYTEGVSVENAIEIISPYDIVVDCTDNYQTRYLVNDACVLLDKPFVYGAIHKFEGQVSVFNYNGGPTYRCIYPELPPQESISNCSESGVIGVLPGIIGALQANEVIKMLIGLGEVLSGKLMFYSSKDSQMKAFKIDRKDSDFYATLQSSGTLIPSEYTVNCDIIELKELSFLQEQYDQIVDVRNKDELPLTPNLKTINIPLGELKMRYKEIDPSKKTIVFCKSGVRSQKAIDFLNLLDLNYNLENLEGGILSFVE